MAKKGKKKKKSGRKTIQDALIVYGVAAVFLILGIYGILSSGRAYREYQNSTDVRTVDSTVTQVNTKVDIVEDGGINEKKYTSYAELEYEVDGVIYSGKESFYDEEIMIGDIIPIEVYKTSEGDYKIPEVSNGFYMFLLKICYYASLAVGIVIALAQTVVLIKKD